MESGSIDESTYMYKKVMVWSEGDTKLLLDLYASFLPEIGPLKAFRNKKDMWIHTAAQIPGKTAKQCEERLKTVLKRKKSAVDNNNTSGSKRQKIDFEDEVNKICLLDDSIEPEVQMSSQFKIKKEILEKPVKRSIHTSKKSKTVQDTLLEIAEKKEEGKERRHKEKLDAVEKMRTTLLHIFEEKQ